MAHRKLPKKPRKPKRSASLASWQNFDARVADWKNKVSQILSERTKKETLIKKYSGNGRRMKVVHRGRRFVA